MFVIPRLDFVPDQGPRTAAISLSNGPSMSDLVPVPPRIGLVQEIAYSKTLLVEGIMVYGHISIALVQLRARGQKPWVASCQSSPVAFPGLFGKQVSPQYRPSVRQIGLQGQILNLGGRGQMDYGGALSEPCQKIFSRINGTASRINDDVLVTAMVQTLNVFKDFI